MEDDSSFGGFDEPPGDRGIKWRCDFLRLRNRTWNHLGGWELRDKGAIGNSRQALVLLVGWS